MLSIESSSQLCAVSLFKNKEAISTIEEKKEKSHSQLLGNFIKEVIQSNNIHVNDLESIAINIGPGSYTGLRIGLSIAKGLAVPFKIPIIAIPAFDILKFKYNLNKSNKYNLAIFSHSNYVYSIDSKSNKVSLTNYKNISKNNLYGHNLIKLPEKVKYTEVFSDSISVGSLALDNSKRYLKQENLLKINPIYISNNQLYGKKNNR